MKGEEKDPFERLSRIAAPEPDPAKIEAVAAMSSRAFAINAARASEPLARTSRLVQWIGGGNWLVPASAFAFTVFVAAALIALIDRPDMAPRSSSDTAVSREPAAVADAPTIETEQATPPQEEGVRMGAAPSPSTGLPLDLRNDVVVRTYSFDGIEIVMRSAPEEVILSLVDGETERQFDRRFKEPSDNIILTDAFVQSDNSDRPVLLIRSGFEDRQQQWDAFVDNGRGYQLSGALSRLVYDAADRAEVAARLQGPTGSSGTR